MKVAIIGTQGIPANYGGFETLAEQLSVYLATKTGISVTVFCSGKKKEANYKGVELKYIPLKANNFQGVFYDLVCILLCIKKFDRILLLGSPAGPFFDLIPGLKAKLIFNYGGLDFKRNKWPVLIQKFIAFGKKRAVKNSRAVIADNQGIYEFIKDHYNYTEASVIEYGADHSERIIKKNSTTIIDLKNYSLTIARIQKDNNIETILRSAVKYNFNCVIVGNWHFSSWGKNLKSKYKEKINIVMLDPIYDVDKLYSLRRDCSVYIHGHSAGGTNPTLVEAMYLGLEVFAYDNVFNRYTTDFKCHFWQNEDDLGQMINKYFNKKLSPVGPTLKKIANHKYNWGRISKLYLEVLLS